MPINRHANWRLEFGFYEPGVAGYFKQLTKGARVGYDVGSADGYYALAMLRQGLEFVYAFEVDDSRARLLRETITRNGMSDRVEVLRCLVGRQSGDHARSIDELVEVDGIRPPDLIKMDIEGDELEALQGGIRTIATARPSLILEVHSRALEQQCTEFLRKAGYGVSVIENGWFSKRLLPEQRGGENRWLVARYPGRVDE